MASGDRIQRVVLQYDVDAASTRRVVDSTEKFGKALTDAEKRAAKLSETAETKLRRSLGELGRQKYIDSIGAELRKATKDAGTFEAALKEVGDELRRIGATESEIDRVAQAATGQGSSRRRNTLERIGREIVGIPDIGPSTDIGQALRLVGAAGGTVKELGIAAAIAGPAIALAANALREFARQNEEIARTTRGFISAQEEVYRLLVTGTSGDARERLREIEDEREITRRRLEETREFIRQAEAAVDNGDLFTNVMGNAAIALGVNVGGIQDLRAEEAKLAEQYEANRIATDRITQALDTNQFALNDTEASIRNFFESLDERAAAVTETVSEFADTLFEVGEKARASNQRIQELEARRDEQLTQISQEAADARTKLIEDAEIRHTRLVEDGEARVAEIRRRANAAFLNASRVAIGQRDALGLYMAKLAKEEAERQADEQEQQNQKALTRLQEDLTRQLQLNRDAERKRLQAQRESAQRQIDTEVAKANALLQIQSRQVNAQIQIAAQGAGAVVGQTASMFNGILAQAASAARAANAMSGADVYRFFSNTAGSMTTSPYSGFGTPPAINLGGSSNPRVGTRTIPQYASGVDRLPHNTLAYLHKDEAVLNPADARVWREGGARGSSPFAGSTFVFNGINRRQLHREFDRMLDRKFAQEGF